MQHTIKLDELGAQGPPMAEAVEACVHCGFCLPACPTYLELGEEMDSPRGRIFLMKEVLEGRLDHQQAAPYVDRCLGCLGCVTACPSGVQYGELLTPFRAELEERRRRSVGDRMFRSFVLNTLPYPSRFRAALWAARLARRVKWLLPRRSREMLELLPARLPKHPPLPEVVPAHGTRRARVALLAGCAQQVLAPQINWATLRVLARNGVETVVPKSQRCCGALAAHTGADRQAMRFARHNVESFPDDVDAIVTNAAGCGSGMKEYGLWLAGDPAEDAARRFAEKVVDVSKLLCDLGPVAAGDLPQPMTVAYHDACHLAHAQKIKSQPRQLLKQIGGLKLVEIPNGEICCGSAGTYNIEQPQIAQQLGRGKAEAIAATGADAVATGNIGCMAQIQSHLAKLGRPLPVYHTMELLDMAASGAALEKR